MPVAGRKPKPEGLKRNRHAPTHEWVEVPKVRFVGRKLPARMPDGRPWPSWTKKWWAAVSSMPHCVLWDDEDWQFGFDTAVVAAKFHEGDVKAATELRGREKILGTTLDFRRDLRIRYVDPAVELEEKAGVTNLDSYRDAIS